MEAGGRLQGRADLHSKGDQTHTCDTANDSQTAEKKKVGGEFTPIELHPFFFFPKYAEFVWEQKRSM